MDEKLTEAQRRGFVYDPDAVEAAENGTLKAEVEQTTEANAEVSEAPAEGVKLEGVVDIQVIDAIKDAIAGGPVTSEDGQEGELAEESKEALAAKLAELEAQTKDLSDAIETMGDAAETATEAVDEFAASIAKKANTRMFKELRSRDTAKKRTCDTCLTRVPVAEIGTRETCNKCLGK